LTKKIYPTNDGYINSCCCDGGGNDSDDDDDDEPIYSLLHAFNSLFSNIKQNFNMQEIENISKHSNQKIPVGVKKSPLVYSK
jgi:hypothetical protein